MHNNKLAYMYSLGYTLGREKGKAPESIGFPRSDGPAIVVRTEAFDQWRALCREIGRPDACGRFRCQYHFRKCLNCSRGTNGL